MYRTADGKLAQAIRMFADADVVNLQTVFQQEPVGRHWFAAGFHAGKKEISFHLRSAQHVRRIVGQLDFQSLRQFVGELADRNFGAVHVQIDRVNAGIDHRRQSELETFQRLNIVEQIIVVTETGTCRSSDLGIGRTAQDDFRTGQNNFARCRDGYDIAATGIRAVRRQSEIYILEFIRRDDTAQQDGFQFTGPDQQVVLADGQRQHIQRVGGNGQRIFIHQIERNGIGVDEQFAIRSKMCTVNQDLVLFLTVIGSIFHRVNARGDGSCCGGKGLHKRCPLSAATQVVGTDYAHLIRLAGRPCKCQFK